MSLRESKSWEIAISGVETTQNDDKRPLRSLYAFLVSTFPPSPLEGKQYVRYAQTQPHAPSELIFLPRHDRREDVALDRTAAVLEGRAGGLRGVRVKG
jgi:hypothetical protein